MANIQGVIFCDNCGVEITWAPYIVQPDPTHLAEMRRAEYCCQECAEGRPCHCAERMEQDDDRRNPAVPSGW